MLKDFIYSLVFSVVFLFSTSVYAEKSAGAGTYSEGYRMGMITKFSIKGLMNKSGEGQMLMGREGTPYSIKTKDGRIVVNPWYFSADKKDSKRINPFVGEYVWVKYNQARFKSFSYDTEYMVVDIQKPSKKEVVGCVEDDFKKGSKSNGIRVGRIVKISKKGTISKSYEMIMQIGNAGNQFKNMTVKSKKMYNCMVDVLKTAKRVRIVYSQSFFRNPFSSDTTYTVVKVEPISDI